MLFLASCICAGLLLSSLPTVNAEPPADPFAEDHLSTGWQTILSETFEGTFPSGNWSVSEQGDFNLLWDDDDYRPHNGTWAAWPARGGSDGRNPVPGNDDYFNGMNTRMVYGPFSLADAEQANVSYWMNPAMQSPGDYLAFEVSTNGVNFNELSHVSGGGGTNWYLYTFSLNSYIGDNPIWVSWRFSSDNSGVMDGPWVDDILIKKYVLGEVTVHTGLAYDDRWDYSQPAEGVQVRLYEADPGGEDDLLFLDYASAEGYFDESPLLNWDEDGGEQNPEDRRLDLYVCWVTENEYYSITNIASSPYDWCSETRENIGVDDEWFYYGLPQGNTTLPAMWIYQDIRRSRQYYIDHTYLQIDPGYIKAHWENGVNSENVPDSHFWALGDPHVFIADQNAESTDIVVHETGHQIMWNLNGLWLWNEFSCWYHDIWSEESPQCAWSEGWSDFYALQVNNDSCFDKTLDLCGEEDEYNLENHTRLDFDNPWGDGVEGRVAGALMDWVDMNNETPWYDDAHLPFDTIAEILPNPNVVTLSLFWSEYWGSFRHEAVRSIFQNTIDYNHSPVINPIEDRTILQDSSISHLINLLDYIGDWESDGWQLDYSIDYISDVNCGISLDEHWVDLTPAAGWVGDCFVRYTVSDSLAETTSNISLIRIEEITERMYLPLIIIN